MIFIYKKLKNTNLNELMTYNKQILNTNDY